MNALNEIPKVCPDCKASHLNTAVEVTVYDGETAQYDPEKVFDPSGEPIKQPVRVFCSECGYYPRITEELADKIAVQSTH